MPALTVLTNSLLIDDVPALLQAGIIHYYRLPHRESWKPVLEKLRAGGFNSVMVPFPWSYHSPAEEFHDFTGTRDISFLLDVVAETGLWLIAHIGPWISPYLGAGGIPPWVWSAPGTIQMNEKFEPSGPSATFLRHLKSWWNKLLPLLIDQPNHVLTILHPGKWSFRTITDEYKKHLYDLATNCGNETPFVWPSDDPLSIKRTEKFVFQTWQIEESLLSSSQSSDTENTCQLLTISRAEQLPSVDKPGNNTQHLNGHHHLAEIADAIYTGTRVIIVDALPHGCNWGYWAVRGMDPILGHGELLDEESRNQAYYQVSRDIVLTTETFNPILLAPETKAVIYSSPEANLVSSYTTGKGSVALLETGQNAINSLRLSSTVGGDTILSEDIHLPKLTARMIPLNIPIAGGFIETTTMEVILITEIAGRSLCILRNEVGGAVQLSDHFRLQHTRGNVMSERTAQGWTVRFNPGRLISIILEGQAKVLQLLALDNDFADRVWPLDDSWRRTPVFPGSWYPTIEDPVPGVIIGPDFVIPDRNGCYRYQVSKKGFGYRWGPWRGSDPRTWLAPFSWRAPTFQDLPLLRWEVKPGIVEVLPDYPDALWRMVPENAPLAMENFDVTGGFIWYRGIYKGLAESIALRCSHNCDVFLNGHLLATLKTAPDFSNGGVKTIPLPERHQQKSNVLAILVENVGRAVELDIAQQKHGLTMCFLTPNIPIHWRVRKGIQGEKSDQGFSGYVDWQHILNDGISHITWHRSEFRLDFEQDVEQPVYFELDPSPGKQYIYLNGILISRSGGLNSLIRRYWLPDGLLETQGINELLVMQWTRGGQPQLGQTRLLSSKTMIWYSDAFNTR